MGLVLDDVRVQQVRAGGMGAVARAIAATGMRHAQVELLGGWWREDPGGPGGDDRTDLLDAATTLAEAGLRTQLKVTEDLAPDPADRVDPSAMTGAWVALAEVCADRGVELVVEPVPFGNLATVEAGARFVQGAGHVNGGLLVDYWHVVRGGSTQDSLRAAIDPAYLRAVELCDGPAPFGPQTDPTVDLATEASTERLLPGKGAWDVAGFARVVRDLGYDGPWGVEIASTVERTRPVEDLLSDAATAARAVLG